MPNPFTTISQPPIEQHVYLVPQRDDLGKVSWTWMYNGNSGTAANFPAISANNGRNDIHFTIVDASPQPIKFAGWNGGSGVSDAIWLSPAGAPTAKQPGFYGQKEFDPPTFGKDGMQLHLVDKNGKKTEFVYQLNFVDSANGSPVTAIDPIISNGNGGNKAYAMESLVVYAALAAVLSILFVRFALGWRKV